MRLGFKFVAADLTSRYHTFSYLDALRTGDWIEAANPTEHPGVCPLREGDGLCVALTVEAATSGEQSASTAVGLVVEFDDADVLAESDGKVRVRRLRVIDVFDPMHLIRLGLCKDLAGADLRNGYLHGANLVGADLRGAFLNGARLTGAHLFHASLCHASLFAADLRGADLRKADLRDADLRRADLSKAALSGANLDRASLYQADLRGADLRHARFHGWELHGANLEGALLPRYLGA